MSYNARQLHVLVECIKLELRYYLSKIRLPNNHFDRLRGKQLPEVVHDDLLYITNPKLLFAKKGGTVYNPTPRHDFPAFECKEYAPLAFAIIREIFDINTHWACFFPKASKTC